jgi:bacteriocin biosynthesis cyclodehydratase domain-containing protein
MSTPLPAGARVRLRPSVEPFSPTGRGDVFLLRPGNAPDLVVRDPDPLDRALIELLAVRAWTLDELQRAVAERGLTVSAVAERVAALWSADAAVAYPETGMVLSDVDAKRFARQLPYLAEDGDPEAAQRRLRDAHVVVLGCGGLGTWALAGLASAGVGAFTLVDDDVVELSNLNRQVLFCPDDLGRPKAELAASWVRRFDRAIDVRPVVRRVRGPNDVRALLDGADVLVQAADWPPYELGRWVDAACVDAGVPWIAAGQMPPLLKIGPTYGFGASACFACHERQLRAESPYYDELVSHRRAATAPATTLGPASGVVGTLLSLEVMHLLLGGLPPATAGCALLVDMRTLEVRSEPVRRDPACRACGKT